MLYDGKQHALVDADPAVAACVGPTLLGTRVTRTAQTWCIAPKHLARCQR